jgi:hypothetical protein
MPRQQRLNNKIDRRKRRLARRKRANKVLSGYLLAQTLTGVATGSVAALITSITSTQGAYANNVYTRNFIAEDPGTTGAYYISTVDGNTDPVGTGENWQAI